MKILVLSDSHSSLRFMRRCLETIQPDVMFHLGDYYDDGQAMAEEFPGVTVYQVPGNCDKYRAPVGSREVLMPVVGGVRFYITHGHLHHVKMTLWSLLKDARAAGAEAALYGHTHEAYCHREGDGLWVMNPGSCGYSGGKAGIVEVSHGTIQAIRLIDESDLEEML